MTSEAHCRAILAEIETSAACGRSRRLFNDDAIQAFADWWAALPPGLDSGVHSEGIELIAASSPQAKGRIERIHGTHQDRLVKKLRRKGVVSHEAVNVYLRKEYLPEHNRRFARTAARPEDYHRRGPRAAELDRIFRLESERVVSEDGVVRYANRYFQLSRQAPARSKVRVCEGRHGSMAIEYRGQALRWEEIPAPLPRVASGRQGGRLPAERRKWVPPADHPWRKAAGRAAQRKAMRESVKQPPLAWPCASP